MRYGGSIPPKAQNNNYYFKNNNEEVSDIQTYIQKTNNIKMIRGYIEIVCNNCSESFCIPSLKVLISPDALKDVKDIATKEGWLYKNMSECYCRECRKKFE